MLELANAALHVHTSRVGTANTPFGAIAAVARRAARDGEVVRWPSPRWRDDPAGFAREVLGIELWSAQVEIVEAIRDHRNVTVRSGHKCGKSTALAVAALWFYASFDRARVMMTAVKASQIDEVIWKEVRRLYRGAKIPLGPIGDLHELARSGLRSSEDERQVWGMTARDGEGLAGISGPNVLVLVDEASGIHDRFFETLGSSLAGSGGTVRKAYISNPTRTSGEFYRSHTTNSALFKCIHVSSEDTPNARGTGNIPGLAGPVWIAEKVAEYGVDSVSYKVRVQGQFVHDRDGKIISLDLLATSAAAWDDAPELGPLQLGIDPAGDGVLGDETAISVRRGNKILSVIAWRGLSEAGVVVNAIGTLALHRRDREPARPRIALDCEGGIGARVLGLFRAHLDGHENAFDLVPVRSGKKMLASPEYRLVRDALWGETQKWLLAGGAIPDDVKLRQDLNAPSWDQDPESRYVATPKDALRKLLDRSPDRGDAVCLSVWGHQADASREDAPAPPPAACAAVEASRDEDDDGVPSLDPYAAAGTWGT